MDGNWQLPTFLKSVYLMLYRRQRTVILSTCFWVHDSKISSRNFQAPTVKHFWNIQWNNGLQVRFEPNA